MLTPILAAGTLALFAAARLSRRKAKPGPLVLDAQGAAYPWQGEPKSVAWDDLVEIGILNTSDGPFVEDQFWVLLGASGACCIVPGMDALPLLRRVGTLPGFDHEQVIRSAACTDDAKFVCWKGAAGDASALGQKTLEMPIEKP